MFIKKKKKKIPNTQTKTKPSNPRTVTLPQRARRCRRRRLPDRPSSQIGDRRTQIALPLLQCSVLAARCSLRPSLKVFRSFSLWLSLSLSPFISLKLKRKWIAQSQIDIVDCRLIIGSSLCASTSAPVSGARCFLRQSGPPSRFFSLNLSQTLNLSLSLSH